MSEESSKPGSRVWQRLSLGQHEIIKVAAGTGQGQASPQELTGIHSLQAFSLTPECAHHWAHNVCVCVNSSEAVLSFPVCCLIQGLSLANNWSLTVTRQ